MPRTRRGANAPLYDKLGDQVLTHKSKTELDKMISTGEAIRVCKRCGMPGGAKRCNGVSAQKQPHQMIYAATDLFRDTHISSCYITEADMLANVGIAGTAEQKPLKGRIAAAQAKVREYGRMEAERFAGMIVAKETACDPLPIFSRAGDENFETPFGDVRIEDSLPSDNLSSKSLCASLPEPF